MPDYNHTPVIPRVGLQANLDAAVAVPNELLWTTDTFRLYVEQGGVKRLVGGAGAGDMLKSVYDTDANNIVDRAENIDGGTW